MKYLILIFLFFYFQLSSQTFNQADTAAKAKDIYNHLIDLQQLGTSEGYKKCLKELEDYKSWIKLKKSEGLGDSLFNHRYSKAFIIEAYVYEALNKPGDLDRALVALDSVKSLMSNKIEPNDFNKLNYHLLRTKIFEKQKKYSEALKSTEFEYEIAKKSFKGTEQKTYISLSLLHKIDILLKMKPLQKDFILKDFETIEKILHSIVNEKEYYNFLYVEYVNVRIRYCNIAEDFQFFHAHKKEFEKVLSNKTDILYLYETWYKSDSILLPSWVNKYIELKNQVFDEKSLSEMNNIRAELDLVQKESALKIANIETQKAQNRNLFLIFIILMISALGLWILFLFRNQKRLNSILQTQKQEIEEQKDELYQSEQDKTLLLRELHHRVKNNLQMLSSMFRLQLNRLEDEKSIEVLKQGQNRVNALSLLHQDLYLKDNVSDVNFEKYCSELLENVLLSFQIKEYHYKPRVDIPILHIESAIPIGLILSELLTNSCKYRPEKNLEIQIQAFLNESKELIFIYQDNQNSLIDLSELEKSDSFGVKLIKMLTLQLKGELEISNNEGLRYSFCFKKITYGKN